MVTSLTPRQSASVSATCIRVAWKKNGRTWHRRMTSAHLPNFCQTSFQMFSEHSAFSRQWMQSLGPRWKFEPILVSIAKSQQPDHFRSSSLQLGGDWQPAKSGLHQTLIHHWIDREWKENDRVQFTDESSCAASIMESSPPQGQWPAPLPSQWSASFVPRQWHWSWAQLNRRTMNSMRRYE